MKTLLLVGAAAAAYWWWQKQRQPPPLGSDDATPYVAASEYADPIRPQTFLSQIMSGQPITIPVKK